MKASGRSSADETLAASLATGRTIADSAAAAGVGETTVYRRLRCPVFAARVRELRASMVAAALGRLTDGMSGASDALNKLVRGRDAEMRFKAAKAVIELALRVRDQADIEERLAAVERTLHGETDEQPESGATQTGRASDEEDEVVSDG